MPFAFVRRENRTYARPFTAKDVGRICRYALRSGATADEILKAVSEEFVNAQIDAAKDKLKGILPRLPGKLDPLGELAQKAEDFIPPLGLAVDTIERIYGRIHRLGELLFPNTTANVDAKFAEWLDWGGQKVQPMRDKLNEYVTAGNEFVESIGEKVKGFLDVTSLTPEAIIDEKILSPAIKTIGDFLSGKK